MDQDWHETIDHDEPLIHDWRARQLARLGIPRALAEAVADHVDWHQIAALVCRGCPPRLALQIVLLGGWQPLLELLGVHLGVVAVAVVEQHMGHRAPAARSRILARLAADGLVKAGGKQRTDSTHVIAAVAALNRLELAGESVRAAGGGAGRGAPGLAGAADLRAGLEPPLRHAGDVVAAAGLADEAG